MRWKRKKVKKRERGKLSSVEEITFWFGLVWFGLGFGSKVSGRRKGEITRTELNEVW